MKYKWIQIYFWWWFLRKKEGGLDLNAYRTYSFILQDTIWEPAVLLEKIIEKGDRLIFVWVYGNMSLWTVGTHKETEIFKYG